MNHTGLSLEEKIAFEGILASNSKYQEIYEVGLRFIKDHPQISNKIVHYFLKETNNSEEKAMNASEYASRLSKELNYAPEELILKYQIVKNRQKEKPKTRLVEEIPKLMKLNEYNQFIIKGAFSEAEIEKPNSNIWGIKQKNSALTNTLIQINPLIKEWFEKYNKRNFEKRKTKALRNARMTLKNINKTNMSFYSLIENHNNLLSYNLEFQKEIMNIIKPQFHSIYTSTFEKIKEKPKNSHLESNYTYITKTIQEFNEIKKTNFNNKKKTELYKRIISDETFAQLHQEFRVVESMLNYATKNFPKEEKYTESLKKIIKEEESLSEEERNMYATIRSYMHTHNIK